MNKSFMYQVIQLSFCQIFKPLTWRRKGLESIDFNFIFGFLDWQFILLSSSSSSKSWRSFLHLTFFRHMKLNILEFNGLIKNLNDLNWKIGVSRSCKRKKVVKGWPVPGKLCTSIFLARLAYSFTTPKMTSFKHHFHTSFIHIWMQTVEHICIYICKWVQTNAH